VFGQMAGRFVQPVEDPVGGLRVVFGDVQPDLDQVLAGLSGE